MKTKNNIKLKRLLFLIPFLIILFGFLSFQKLNNVNNLTSNISLTDSIQLEIPNGNPMEYFEEPYKLLDIWSDEPIPIPNYTQEEIDAQKWFNDKEDLILTYDLIPDSLETFPDNLKLPINERNIDYEEITPYTWKWVHFELIKDDGTISIIKLRRPNWWIKSNNADTIGKTIYLSLSDAGIEGNAIVTKILPNQLDTRFLENNWKDNQTYRPITGKFEHNSNDVWNFYFEGETEPIGATSSHPFYSADKTQYIAAGELKIGEKIKTADGETTQLIKKEKRNSAEVVYNLEIYRDHNFYVGQQGLLVHNSCADIELIKYSRKKVDLTNVELPSQPITPKLPYRDGDAYTYIVNNSKITIFDENGISINKQSVNYIIDLNGNIKFGQSHSFLAGENNSVLGAGTFLIKDGEIIAISNLLGHFQPSLEQGLQSFKFLEENLGIDLSNTLDHRIDFSNPDWDIEYDKLIDAWDNQIVIWNE